MTAFDSPRALGAALDGVDYLVDDGLAMALFLATRLGQPLLLEGEPGVGKTSAAKALALALDTPLIRLQCYEGITASEAVYEWNYPKQMLAIRRAEANGPVSSGAAPGEGIETAEGESSAPAAPALDLFTADYLLDRPLLKAVRHRGDAPAVLLIDEIDRSDDEFEALLLEFLGESAVTVPELGTFTAARSPIVVLTSNRSRELHDALKRRCYYHWIEYPSVARAADVVRRRVPNAAAPLVAAATAFVTSARGLDLDKPPGLAEAIDWVSALHLLGLSDLDPEMARATIGAIAKTPDDVDAMHEPLDALAAGS